MNKLIDINIKNKKVLIRVDYNVPIENNVIKNDFRLKSSIETINYCLSQNASVILMSHLGRPNGIDPLFSLEPIIDFLEDTFNVYVHFSEDCISDKSIKISNELLPREIHLLENLRFYEGETNNDEKFAKKLSKHGDIYICDSFGTAHRMHASNSSVLKYFNHKGIGFLMSKEFKYLSADKNMKTTVLIGGAKISSKLKMIYNYLDKCDTILIGGAMAFTLLKSQNINVGSSLVENNMVNESKKILDKANKMGVDIILPIDIVSSTSIDDDSEINIKSIDQIDNQDIGLDIGPETTMIYLNYLSKSEKVIWNGPMGLFENYNYATGTTSISSALKDYTMNNKLNTIIGGGDTVRAIEMTESIDSFTHVSTGGGASLKLLSGEKLDLIKSWEQYE